MEFSDYIMERNYLTAFGRYETWTETELRVNEWNQKVEAQRRAQAQQTQPSVPDPSKRFRILRFIEYTGSLEWVSDCIAKRGIKGTKELGGRGDNVIREGILGDAAELLQHPDLKHFEAIKKRMDGLVGDLTGGGLIFQTDVSARLAKITTEFGIILKRFGR